MIKISIQGGSLHACPRIFSFFGLLGFLLPSINPLAASYSVGPDQALSSIGDVPWERLGQGDRVLIHWRPEPYREKWVICSEGSKEQPIYVTGVVGDNGERPVIVGRDATTRKELDYWNEDRGVIKIGGASHSSGTVPRHLVIENLDVRSARPAYSFDGSRGRTPYRRDAAAIYVESGDSITIRHCRLSDSGNGLFVNGRNMVVEHCEVFDNGIADSFTEHNVYSAVDGITFQFNYFGPLRHACAGNNLKDRSAGIVVRHNWIEGGSRQLDFVDAEDHDGRLVNLPSYRDTFVYGNVIEEGMGDFRSEIVHYGGDSGHREWYRRGTLHFFHNTVVSKRSDITVLFRLSSNEEVAELRNNVFLASDPRGRLALSHGFGTFRLQKNWMSRGWVKTSRFLFLGDLVETGTISGRRSSFPGYGKGDYRVDSARGQESLRAVPLHPRAIESHPIRFTADSKTHWLPFQREGHRLIGAYLKGFPME